ncbi:acidic mammalian chitinase-like [Cynoglossus semilaevis]|uniref:acidic mammalian chitinase-like n=1 Tax=Cynoglossus semilaevis TaxID=244447 RepID=UPI0007DCB53B|nr:acidic mammalian chitinase-like [Cynoglossus semilaevis]
MDKDCVNHTEYFTCDLFMKQVSLCSWKRSGPTDCTMARLLTALGILFTLHLASSTKLVCHMTNWAQYRQSSAQFKPENIDPFLFTHIIYALASIDNFNQIRPIEWNDE